MNLDEILERVQRVSDALNKRDFVTAAVIAEMLPRKYRPPIYAELGVAFMNTIYDDFNPEARKVLKGLGEAYLKKSNLLENIE